MPHIIATANPKGGTGKSTSAANLAHQAARAGVRTLVIDLDPQASSSYLLGLDKDASPNVSALLEPQARSAAELAHPTEYGPYVVPAGPALIEAEDNLRTASLGELRLSTALGADQGLAGYGLVILDTPGYTGRLYTSALIASDDVLIVAKASALTSSELPDLLDTIDALSVQRPRPEPIRILGLAFNEVDQRTRAARYNMAEVRDELARGHPVAESVIPKSTRIEEAAFARCPVAAWDASAKPAFAYEQLYYELIAPIAN